MSGRIIGPVQRYAGITGIGSGLSARISQNRVARIPFDFRDYHKRVAATKDRLEQIQIEADRFRHNDSLSKEKQEEFCQLDRAVRREVADEIAASLEEMKRLVAV